MKILKLTCALFIVALAQVPGYSHAGSGEIVTFRSAPIPPSPFQVKRAKAKGIVLKAKPGLELSARLFRPRADGKQAAVIVLLSGDGLQDSHLAWGQKLTDWGYVGLVVDSFGSRGGRNYRDTAGIDMPADAAAAFAYLRSLEFVDPRRIGVVGFSLGGSELFKILDGSESTATKPVALAAAVAFYPNCRGGVGLSAPLLILAGDADNLMTLNECEKVHANASARGNKVAMQIYPGATHFFDNPAYRKDHTGKVENGPKPLWFEENHYDKRAHKDALRRTREFLELYLR